MKPPRIRTVLASGNRGKLDVLINGKSYHVNSKYDWNETNLGLGLEYELSGSSRWIKSINASAFRDSLDNMSYMAGAGLKRRLLASDRFGRMDLDAGIMAFVMARRDNNDNNPFPGLLPVLSAGNRYAGVNLTYLPKKVVHDIAHANVVDPTIGGVFFMQFRLRLHRFGH
jgi:palmitoyl transferase